MYAIIENCGRQYKVAEGDVVFFEKLSEEENKEIVFDKVLLVSENENVKIGYPYLENIKITGQVVSNKKAKKVVVFKMKPKKNYRKKYGHRQQYSKVKIVSMK